MAYKSKYDFLYFYTTNLVATTLGLMVRQLQVQNNQTTCFHCHYRIYEFNTYNLQAMKKIKMVSL